MKTYTFDFEETYKETVDIEAESEEEAEDKFWDDINSYSRHPEIDNSDLILRAVRHENGETEWIEDPFAPPEQPTPFTHDELKTLSDCLLQAIHDESEAARMIASSDIIAQITAHQRTLADLNAKICNLMTE